MKAAERKNARASVAKLGDRAVVLFPVIKKQKHNKQPNREQQNIPINEKIIENGHVELI